MGEKRRSGFIYQVFGVFFSFPPCFRGVVLRHDVYEWDGGGGGGGGCCLIYLRRVLFRQLCVCAFRFDVCVLGSFCFLHARVCLFVR